VAKAKAKAAGSRPPRAAKPKAPREKKPKVSKAEAAGFPACVRHGAAAKDAALRYYFLCDDCSAKWTAEAFDGNAPKYSGEAVQGYCQLCNRDQEVRLRTWFLCGTCDRVTASIGRNHVAEQAIVDFWENHVQPRVPHLELIRMDVSALRPRRSTDKTASAPLDFLIRDRRTGKYVFGIENKTGRNEPKDIGLFQLDVSDCDSITNQMVALNIPVYVIHAQVLEKWKPPTKGFAAVSLWWTDVYKMSVENPTPRMRSGSERRLAVDYKAKVIFSPISTFPDAVAGPDGNALIERFEREGIPPLYQPKNAAQDAALLDESPSDSETNESTSD
jgi:hypothetical protein